MLARRAFVLAYAADVAVDVIEGKARYYRERQWACLIGGLILVGLATVMIVTWANASRSEDVDDEWTGARPWLLLGGAFLVAAVPFFWKALGLRRPVTVDRLEISRNAIVWWDNRGRERTVPRVTVKYLDVDLWLKFRSPLGETIDPIPLHPFDQEEVRRAVDRQGWEERIF